MRPTPPPFRAPSRRRSNPLAAAKRRADQAAPQGKSTPGPAQSKDLAVAQAKRAVARQQAEAFARGQGKGRVTTQAPPRVLGSVSQPTTAGGDAQRPGDRVNHTIGPQTNQARVTPDSPDAARERYGHKFTVGFTADGRVVHLYGADVPAGQRRVALSKNQSAAAKRRISKQYASSE